MALGDGIRRNIASVDPAERTLLRNALMKMNTLKWNGKRDDVIEGLPISEHTAAVHLHGVVSGGVTWWFKQDEIHTVTHVHNGPEFLPWHRLLVNWFEGLLRVIDPRLSLHYWDWTQDPRKILHANLGDGHTGELNLFTDDFMGYGGSTPKPIGPKWEAAGFYNERANPARTGPFDPNYNPADTPKVVRRSINGSPATEAGDRAIIAADDYKTMRAVVMPDGNLGLEGVHNDMHGFVNMGGEHTSFRDPFVFLLHSNVDRLFALWQAQDPDRRLKPELVYGTESDDPGLTGNIEPWSTGVTVDDEEKKEHFIRPWFKPESLGAPIPYKDPSIVTPPRYE
jgi:Common central domain of tyrosinase